MLFNFLWKRRSREINGGEANNNAAANDGTAGGASAAHTSTESHGMGTSSGCDFEVFLSFRGPDTRAAFTNFLYASLIEAGIRTFKDDEDLRVGEEFAPKLLQAIKQSKISIPIFSKGYASSKWCLKELVQMVECQKAMGQKIMPIFYDVAPSEVRHQTGDYGKALFSHEKKKRCDKKTISEWKAALNAIGEIHGWDLHSKTNREEGEFAKTVTQKIFNELKKAYLVVSDKLVSVDHQVDKIMEIIGAWTSETRIIGIYGMGGVGKTTIAKIVYNKLSHDFKNRCFLPDIRETSKGKGNGIQYLQNQLIGDILKKECSDIKDIYEGTRIIKDRLSNKRVLLLLDDVDEENHMYALVGKRDWFGKGSKLIITTRKRDVLNVPEVDCTYEVNGMDDRQSLQLFSKHAFRSDYPSDEYINQSKRAIKIAGGLPLAIEVIGSLLSRTKKKKWDVKLEKLEDVPDKDVQNKLRISYDALEVQEKHIFLDIACLFIGYDKDIMVYFWESQFHPDDAMDVLENMSLIKIKEDNKVWMHDQLRHLGRQIVRQESKMDIKNQSRVWNPNEALTLLRHEGKNEVKALCLKLDHQMQYLFTYEDFKRLSNLTFLEVAGSMKDFHAEERLLWQEIPSNVLPSNVFQDNSDLLPQLQWLSWWCIPPTFNITNFSMEDVVILDLSNSAITHDWNGWSHMKVIKSLKVLNLSDCRCLGRTPNFSAHANLERLILRGCSKLVAMDRSICQLKHLVYLDVRHCRNLQRLPDELGGLEALKELLIDSTPIKEIPNCQGMRNLRSFTASDCGIIIFPPSIGNLASLEYLSLKGCKSLETLPNSIGNLESLIELDISKTGIKELPDSIGNLKNLKVVKMTESPISKMPDALWTIEKLKEIEAKGKLPFHVKIGNCIHRNQSLRILRLRDAKVYAIPMLPESLIALELDTLYMRTFPDLANLTNLKELGLEFSSRDYDGKSYGPVEEDLMPQWIGKLSKLEDLRLFSDFVTTLPTDISRLPQLKSLDLRCSNLRCLPKLPSSLSSLFLHDCISLCSMDLSNLEKLSSLNIWSSPISEIRGLGCLENLQDLSINDLGQVKILPDLSSLNKLIHLEVQNCGNLVEIKGELPQSLGELRINSCEYLQKLPDLSSLKGLKEVVINDCMELNVVAIRSYARRSWRISGSSQR